MRVGVIGAGGHSRAAHLPALAELQSSLSLDLVAIADTRPEAAEQAASDFGFARSYGGVDALLEENLDACIILTPTPVIPQVVLRVAAHGVACLIEKPFAATSDEAARLVATLNAQAGFFMVSANRRFDPAFTAALAWLAHKPVMATGVMSRSGRHEQDFIYNTGVHLVDALTLSSGSLEVTSRRERRVNGAIWVDASLGDIDGFMGSLLLAPTAGSHIEELCLMTAERSVSIRFGSMQDSGFTAWDSGQLTFQKSTSQLSPWQREGTLAETRAFFEALQCGSPSPVPLSSYLHSMRIAEALNGPVGGLR
jgi:predicted dehydrogenase